MTFLYMLTCWSWNLITGQAYLGQWDRLATRCGVLPLMVIWDMRAIGFFCTALLLPIRMDMMSQVAFAARSPKGAKQSLVLIELIGDK